MMHWSAVGRRLRALFARDAVEREMNEELRFHLEMEAVKQERRGLSPDTARKKAAHRFGGVEAVKEAYRDARGVRPLENLLQDVRYAIRSLRQSPGFALVAILTLALGIGITTAVVSIADHVLVRGLPFREPSRLMTMLERDDHGAFRTPSGPTAADWQRDSGVAGALEGVTYIRGDGMTLRVGDESETVGAAFVGPEFFPLIGVRPTLGRLLGADDHRAGAPRLGVMSYKLWKRRFGGDPAILGRSISVDRAPMIIVGVLPNGAVYPGFADLWTPISGYPRKEILLQRGFHADSRTLGRLRPGVDSARAVALMRGIGARLAAVYPAEQAGWMPGIRAMQLEIVGDVGPMLWTLAAAAAAVLLLACANVASLLLARVTTRRRELAVRSALGASRGRIVGQLLTESLMLALAGGLVGTAIAAFSVTLFQKVPGNSLPRVEELSVDQRVLLIATVATIVTALVCGIWPALRATRHRSGEILRASALGSIGVKSESRMRRVLVTVQFALALVLLVGAGLLLQSFRRAAAVDVGFDPSGLLALRIAPPAGAYTTPREAAALYARLMEAARAVPGVRETAFINHSPFGRAAMYTSLAIEGRSALDSSNQVFYRTVSDSYLRTMGMSMVAGRWFDAEDMRSPGGSFVINETMAKQYWRGASAVGQRITLTRASQGRADFGQPLFGRVVGVVADVHQRSPDVPPDAEVYVPYTLETWPWGMLMMRARDGRRATPALARAVASVDPRLIAPGAAGANAFSVAEEAIAGSLQPRKLSMSLIAAFAACALILAAIGMYGVVAYSIAQRTREIGVRKALGATDERIAVMIARESLAVVAVGVVLGSVAAAGGARLIRGLLFNTGLADPGTYAGTIVLLAGTALLATFLPARRAMRLDPTIAMRGE
ncbi:MAG: ABC transporter permease [Gemmatimonadaceae bacterium]